MNETVFLDENQVTGFRKNRCLFSNDEFRTKLVSSTVQEEDRGSEYCCYTETVARNHHLIQDLDLYVFNFDFTDDSREALSKKRKEFEESVRIFRTEQANRLREHLTQQYKAMHGLPDSQRDMAIEASVGEYNADLGRDIGYWNHQRASKLEINLSKLFHLLELRDLKVVTSSLEDSENTRHSITTYGPAGLKARKSHWPFGQFEDKIELVISYGNLYRTIMKNPVFKKGEYKRKCEEVCHEIVRPPFFEPAGSIKPFNDLESFVLGLDIEVKAQTYNPVDHM